MIKIVEARKWFELDTEALWERRQVAMQRFASKKNAKQWLALMNQTLTSLQMEPWQPADVPRTLSPDLLQAIKPDRWQPDSPSGRRRRTPIFEACHESYWIALDQPLRKEELGRFGELVPWPLPERDPDSGGWVFRAEELPAADMADRALGG